MPMEDLSLALLMIEVLLYHAVRKNHPAGLLLWILRKFLEMGPGRPEIYSAGVALS